VKSLNFFLLFRVVVAGVFIVSGVEKLLSPYENFLYVIQNYEVLPWEFLQRAVALGYPWLELILGVFLLAGLWLRLVLYGIGFMTCSFIGAVGQAILRKLPIESCGCFGELLKVPLPVIILMDSTILLCVILMLRNLSQTHVFSLDRYFK
jgi:uncharacterized membrane protein YphA (DoxX/SURF4 family)